MLLNDFVASECDLLTKELAMIKSKGMSEIRNRVLEEVYAEYGFEQNTVLSHNDKRYEINFIRYEPETVYMELLHEERVMYFYDNAPVKYETHVLRVNLKDFNDFEVVEND